MKKAIILSAIYFVSFHSFSQSISQVSPQNSNPVSNPQLNGTNSNSNNSNSGVNPNGNPGTIISASAVESKGTFQTPVNPNIEPGTFLTSGGPVVPDPNPRYRTPVQTTRAGVVNVENPISVDSVSIPVKAPEPVIPAITAADYSPRRIDSLQRENDRRRAETNKNNRLQTNKNKQVTPPAKKIKKQ